jgi:hypothetical protein
MNEIPLHMDITQLTENFGQNGLGNTLEKYHDKPAEGGTKPIVVRLNFLQFLK